MSGAYRGRSPGEVLLCKVITRVVDAAVPDASNARRERLVDEVLGALAADPAKGAQDARRRPHELTVRELEAWARIALHHATVDGLAGAIA